MLFIAISIACACFYIVYTLAFTLTLHKSFIYYTKGQKTVHTVLIWMIPFLWILLLKYIDKPVSLKQYTNDSNSTGGPMWTDSGESGGSDGGDGGD
ncbi:MAG: hypothetical protein H7259_09370 [Cytophagales bacterium]|nr:hypothetical protein [Cytophaga sp.]